MDVVHPPTEWMLALQEPLL